MCVASMNYAVFVTFVTVASVASLVTGFIVESQIIAVLNVSLSTSKYDVGGEIEFAGVFVTNASVATE
jgi:hypothetical protein